MKYQEFEKQIKTTLGEATENVDIDALIQDIHSNNSSGKKKFGLWFISLLALVLFITVGYGFVRNTQSQTPIDNASNIVLASNNHNTQYIEIQNTQTHKTETETETENKTEEQNTKNRDKENNNSEATISRNNLKNDINLTDENGKQITNNTTNKSLKRYKNNSQFSINNENIDNIKTSRVKTGKTETPSNRNINNYKKEQLELTSSTSVQKNKAIEIKEIKKRDIKLSNFNDLKIKINDPKCYNFSSKASFNWKLGIELGVSNPFKNIENTGKPGEVYLLREKHEQPLEGLSASVFARGNIGKNPLYLKLGVSYARIADNLEASFLTTTMDTTQGIISITKSENGDTLTIITGDIISEITTQRDVKKHYYFHLYDVPFGIGYDF